MKPTVFMKPTVNHKSLKLGLIALVLFLIAGLVWKAQQSQTTPVNGMPVDNKPDFQAAETVKSSLTVRAIQTKPIQWPITLTLNGSIYPWQEAIVSAEIGGLRITQVLADVGSQVKKGQPLVLLSDESVQADLQKQLATVEKDKASLAEAQNNAERAREIKDSGAISAQKINEYLIAEQTAKANLALSQAELENQRIRLRQTKVIAPDDGLVSSRSASLGNVVSSGTELFRLVRQGRLEWRGEINADLQTSIQQGQTVNLSLPNAKSVQGRVRLVSPTVDTNTRNALVYVDIPKTSGKSGMYVQGNIALGQRPGMAVPLSAVIYRDGFAYVFTLGKSDTQGLSKVSQHKVSIGRTRGDLIELTSGVLAQTSVVLSGGAFLNDGDNVRVVDSKPGA